MSILKQYGVADQSTVIRIVDSTDGTPETGVVAATAGLTLWYRRTLGALQSAASPTVNDLAGLLDTLIALGEAKFSTAHENSRDLFETSEEWIERVRSYILDNWQGSK